MSRQIVQPDRRRSPRECAEIQVQYESIDELFTEFTRDINEGGVFVATETPLSLDEPVEMSFRLPGGVESIRRDWARRSRPDQRRGRRCRHGHRVRCARRQGA